MNKEPQHFIREDGLVHYYNCHQCQKSYFATNKEDSLKKAKEAAEKCSHGAIVDKTHKIKRFHNLNQKVNNLDVCFGENSGTFYNDIEEARYAGETIVYGATLKTFSINIDNIIDAMLEEHYEDAGPTDLNGLDELKASVEKFNSRQRAGSYCENNEWQEICYMRTFAMIKPCAQASGKADQIKTDIRNAGFIIEKETVIILKEDEAKWLYREHSNKDHYQDLVDFTISGPVTIMILSSDEKNAPENFRKLMGPTNIENAEPQTLRAKYAEDFRRNAIHGSDGNSSAEKEMDYFGKHFKS